MIPMNEAELDALIEESSVMLQKLVYELETIRATVGLPKDTPVEYVAARVKEVMDERTGWKARSTDYEERWAKLCDLLNVSYAADAETLFGDVMALLERPHNP